MKHTKKHFCSNKCKNEWLRIHRPDPHKVSKAKKTFFTRLISQLIKKKPYICLNCKKKLVSPYKCPECGSQNIARRDLFGVHEEEVQR